METAEGEAKAGGAGRSECRGQETLRGVHREEEATGPQSTLR